MADIAEIGFRADTSDLDDARQKLQSLAPAAATAQRASQQLTASLSANESVTLAVAKANLAAVTATLSLARASDQLNRSDVNAAAAAKRKAQATYDVIKADQLAAKAEITRAVANNQTLASGGINNNVVPIKPGLQRFQTANIAAQFQDIGVTAAMGMNPLQIALQQGTQLSAVLQTMKNPLTGLATAFKQVLNTVSLMTIGIIALVAGLIELVDWIKVAKGLLYGVAYAVQYATPYILGMAAALALIYSGSIISGFTSVTIWIVRMAAAAWAAGIRMAAAWLVSLGPLGLIVGAVSLITVALIAFGKQLSKTLGTDLVKDVKDAGNWIVGAFVGAYNGIVQVWKLLPDAIGDIMIQVANYVLKVFQDLTNKAIEGINELTKSLPEWLTNGKDLTISFKADFGQFDNEFAGSADKAGEVLSVAMKQAMGKDYIGDASAAIDKSANALANKIRKYADSLGEDTKAFDKIVTKGNAALAVLQVERDGVYQSAEAVSELKHQTELLNEAKEKNIKLTPTQTALLKNLGTQMAVTEEQTRSMKEGLDFAKDATKGFFSDMKDGLAQGESLWQAFGDAVNKVLSKLEDKLLDVAVNSLFTQGGGGTTQAGFLNSVAGAFRGIFNAKGNAFDSGGIHAFANGGAFTNSVVSKPTAFTFANGGALGVMGEAGPEAIMPLKRGANGSLGVQMYSQPMASNDNGGGAVINVNVINNSKAQVNTQQSQNGSGIDIDVMIDEVTANNIMKTGTKTNQAIKAQQTRQLIKR